MTNSKSNRTSKNSKLRTPNVGGPLKDPRYVVLHYTASTNFKNTVAWLCNKSARASAHIVLGRDGLLDALVPYDVTAWHAGPSNYKGLTGLNNHAIGIEMINAGPLKVDAERPGVFRAVVGNQIVTDVFEGKHKTCNIPGEGPAYEYWQSYPDEQLARLDLLLGQLFHDYPSLVEVVGHDDIAVGRKFDPGPAFDTHMTEFKKKYDRY